MTSIAEAFPDVYMDTARPWYHLPQDQDFIAFWASNLLVMVQKIVECAFYCHCRWSILILMDSGAFLTKGRRRTWSSVAQKYEYQTTGSRSHSVCWWVSLRTDTSYSPCVRLPDRPKLPIVATTLVKAYHQDEYWVSMVR